MSAGISSGPGHRGAATQDFELNLASIIDCFTVLIAFMLVTASFLSIGILDAGVAASAPATGQTTEPPPIQISLELNRDHSITIKTTGKESRTHTLAAPKLASAAASPAGWDYDALTASLADLHKRWPTVGAVTLQAENFIEYRDVVKTMEITKRTLPVVLLGGF